MAETNISEPRVRRRRPRTPTGIPYSTVAALIASLHGIDGEDLPALASRLQNLRRLNFPDGVAAGSGRHFAYDAADVLGVAFAFELVEAFVPPAVAVDVVREGWPEIAQAGLQGWGAGSAGAVIIVHPRALGAGLGRGAAAGGLHHVETEWAAGAPELTRIVQIDVGHLAQRIERWLRHSDRRSHELMDGGMQELRRRFGGGPPLERETSPPRRLGANGPFWRRASILLEACNSGFAKADERRLRWYLDYCARPAPVDAWKRRVEVAEGVDAGFAAALAWVCNTAGLVSGRADLDVEALERLGRTLSKRLGSRADVIARLKLLVGIGLGGGGEVGDA